jgi:uncharacterized protein YneF (UPF0154 family)
MWVEVLMPIVGTLVGVVGGWFLATWIIDRVRRQ